ncbi:MAG: type IIA DNA topoisomerase subunit B [Betaproteobacteria bacterium]|jgi:topoisomerase-4 subunit B|nr:type IIA DNA topoisomerase subunit B [Betaproteobacteria bacterium]
MAEQRKNNYNESSIRVLRGLEPVRQRPGMYTRTENALHILQEVIDNSADEALAGHAKNIHVTLHSDGSVSVADDGRGIPVGKHPDENVSVVEIVFTRLHAGGKFDKTAGGAYAFSGGLHGVGVSVTNALSKRLEVTVWRDGGEHRIVFADGEVIEPLKRTSAAAGRAGTSVRVWPDAKYFDDAAIPAAELARSLKARAVLLPGVITHLVNEKTGKSESWRYQGGLKDYLLELVEFEPLVVDPWLGEGYVGAGDETFAIGEGAQWAVAWTAEGSTPRESFVNLIPTTAGGTHEAGLREGLFSAVKGFIEQHNLMPKGVKVLPEDVFSRVSFVLSAKVLDPQFQGQTKEKLTSRDALRLVASQIRPPLELWLNRDLESARKIAELAIRAAQHRARSAQKIEKKKGSGVAVLPGKLTDCESTDIARNEIFLVEGDSAGGSAKMGRDKEFQAILPLRGKVLNTWETEPDRLFANAEVHDIAVALGIDPHGISESINWNNLRYGKVCILSDADVDGAHIQVLLLTLFFKHFPQLVQRGHVFVARPPLFRIDVNASGKRAARKLYALDDGELTHVLDKLRQEGLRETAWSISRFKGLGEMSAEQLWETTLNPDTRRLSLVALGEVDAMGTTKRFHLLMGRTEAASRRAWLEEKGHEAEADL